MMLLAEDVIELARGERLRNLSGVLMTESRWRTYARDHISCWWPICPPMRR